MEKKRISIKQLAILGLVTALMCVLAPVSIPTGIVPISLGSFVVYLTVYIVGLKIAVISNVMYILIGAVGMPVFTGFQGGLQKLAGPTGGYIIGYILVTLIAGIALKLFKRNVIAYIIALFIGTVVLYAFGTAWFMHVTNMNLSKSLALCVYPFVVFDLCKIIVAAITGPIIRRVLVRTGLFY